MLVLFDNSILMSINVAECTPSAKRICPTLAAGIVTAAVPVPCEGGSLPG